jgi:hypothetical protein
VVTLILLALIEKLVPGRKQRDGSPIADTHKIIMKGGDEDEVPYH